MQMNVTALQVRRTAYNVCKLTSVIGQTSPAIASFVTSYARIQLYNLMDGIEQTRSGRVLYADTDSCIFIHRQGDEAVTLGNYLGELTDELEGYQGYKCYHGIFPGPKSYALKLRKMNGDGMFEDKHIVKNKGVTMNYEASKTLNADVMQQKAELFRKTGKCDRVDVLQQTFITRGQRQRIYRREFIKRWRVSSHKRVVTETDTFPFGYVEML